MIVVGSSSSMVEVSDQQVYSEGQGGCRVVFVNMVKKEQGKKNIRVEGSW